MSDHLARIYVVVMIGTMIVFIAKAMAREEDEGALPLCILASMFWPLLYVGMAFYLISEWRNRE